MAITNAIENFHMTVNEGFLAKAQALTPKLIETEVRPVSVIDIVPQSQDFIAAAAEQGFISSRPMGRDDVLCLDSATTRWDMCPLSSLRWAAPQTPRHT